MAAASTAATATAERELVKENGSGGGEHSREVSSDQVEKPRKRQKDKDRDRDLEEEEERAASRKRHRSHHHRDHRDRERHHRDHRSDHHRRHRHHRQHSSDGSSGDDEDKDKEASDIDQDDGERRRHHRSSSHRHRSSSGRHRSYSKSRSSSRHHRHHHRQSKSPSEADDRKSGRRSRSPSSKAKSRSPSKAPEERSRSRSRSESKRASGFDVLPSGVPAIAQPGMVMTYGMQSTMTQQATRHARRVYVGGLPPMVNEQGIAAFFNQVMENVGGNTFGLGDSVVNVYINHEKRFAFVEMRSVEEASNAMALDGIFFNGIAVRVKRPSDYDQEVAARLGPIHPSPCLNLAAVGLQYRSSYAAAAATADILSDKIYVGNIPQDWTEDDVRKLMEPFGALKSVDLPKDAASGNPKGYGFVVYMDSKVTDTACNKLNQTSFGDKTLVIRRANVNGQPKAEVPSFMGPQQVSLPHSEGDIPTKVVCLSNAVSKEDLKDESEYKEIVEDMMEECGKYGDLRKVEIPRATGGKLPSDVPGLGKVFLEYKDVTGSIRAKCTLDGRKFAGNTVEARYYPEHRFAAGDYSF